MFNLEQLEAYEAGTAESDVARFHTLMHRCGDDDGGTSEVDRSEIYVARLGDSSFAGAHGWHVEFSVEGDEVTATIKNVTGTLIAPPLPAPPDSKTPPPPPQPMATPKVALFTKAQLSPIAKIWRDPQLWDAPQETIMCTDGMPSILEACVHGRYAMRDLHCSAGSQQAFVLWKTMQRLLPSPDDVIPKSGE